MAYVNSYIENFQPEIRQAGGLKTKLPITTISGLVIQSGVALVAAGNPTPAISIGSTTGPNIYTGSGAPTITAPQGSLYLRSDGSSGSTRAYINTTGSTTWTPISTVG